MQDIYKLLNRMNDAHLLHRRLYARAHKRRMKLLNKYGIKLKVKSDIDCLYVEMIMYCIGIKNQLEDIFYQTYGEMYDYWNDLTYLQRKDHMNLDIHRLTNTLPYFTYENQDIYMPAFDEFMNRLYYDEIVLLVLKQYHKIMDDFKDHVVHLKYGCDAFDHGFTSAQVVAKKDSLNYVLFHPEVKRLYEFKDNQLFRTLSLDVHQKECPMALLMDIGEAILLDDEKKIIEDVLEYPLISKHQQKKVQKYYNKKYKE